MSPRDDNLNQDEEQSYESRVNFYSFDDDEKRNFEKIHGGENHLELDGHISETLKNNKLPDTATNNKNKKTLADHVFMKEFMEDMKSWDLPQFIDESNKFANWMDQKAQEYEQEATKINELIDANYAKMVENANFAGEARNILDANSNGEEIDQQKVKDLLKKRGHNMDSDMSVSALLTLLQNEMDAANAENQSLEVINDKLYEKYEDKKSLANTYKNNAGQIRERSEDIKTKYEAGEISEQEAKEEYQNLWNDVPEEVLDQYLKENRGFINELENDVISSIENKASEDNLIVSNETSDEPENTTTNSAPAVNIAQEFNF